MDQSQATERPMCRHPNSCNRHKCCMYVGCPHNTSGLKLPDSQYQTTRIAALAAIRIKAHHGHPDYPVTESDVDLLLIEIDRLQRIEAEARVQHEAYGAYPGLVKALNYVEG